MQLVLSFLSSEKTKKKLHELQPKKSINIEKPLRLPPFDRGYYITNPNNALL